MAALWAEPGLGLFSVGNPDIFYLGRVLEEPATLGNVTIEPVDDVAPRWSKPA